MCRKRQKKFKKVEPIQEDCGCCLKVYIKKIKAIDKWWHSGKAEEWDVIKDLARETQKATTYGNSR